MQNEEVKTGLMDYTKPRVRLGEQRQGVRNLRRQLHRARVVYAGGTEAERQAAAQWARSVRIKCRQAWLSRQGREIDLLGILSILDADSMPAWSVVCPMTPIGRNNGGVTRCGDIINYLVPSIESSFARHKAWRDPYYLTNYHEAIAVKARANGLNVDSYYQPSETIPPLPARVRRLANDRKIQSRAMKILVLSPATWEEHKLVIDPALIVEWRDLPGRYYALAVWGGDYHRIMEFVH